MSESLGIALGQAAACATVASEAGVLAICSQDLQSVRREHSIRTHFSWHTSCQHIPLKLQDSHGLQIPELCWNGPSELVRIQPHLQHHIKLSKRRWNSTCQRTEGNRKRLQSCNVTNIVKNWPRETWICINPVFSHGSHTVHIREIARDKRVREIEELQVWQSTEDTWNCRVESVSIQINEVQKIKAFKCCIVEASSKESKRNVEVDKVVRETWNITRETRFFHNKGSHI
mmetsp:Transcript_5273/g.8347  ORF Transcript_5273/g.8347 Transcript_5273/m.8347 type:complete len:230 (+) Transcript_5273:174-863(+)